MAAINPAVVLAASLGESLGVPDYAPGLTFGEALQHAENMEASDHPLIKVDKIDTAGQCNIADLPAEFATEPGRMIEYFADYVGDFGGDIPWHTLHDLAKTCDYKSMPEPFSLKREPAGQYSTKLFIIKKPDGKHDILKDVSLLSAKTRTDTCMQMCRGACLIWRYGNQYRIGRLAVQYMLEKLEGFQLRYHTVVAKPGKGPSRKTAERGLKAAGYKFIREKGPRSNNANQFMEFADRESARPESPIFGWEESRIERALNNFARGRANAKGLTTWVLTLRDFDPWFLNEVIRPTLASTLRGFGVAWLCKTRVGKSAGSKTLAFMMSRVEIDALEQSGEVEKGDLLPTAVTAKHFDFFKGEPVIRIRPAIFDDGELSEQSAFVLKAFLNPSEEDATPWARWGSPEFDTGSSRQVCNNACDKDFEAELVSKWTEGTPKDVSSDDFMKLIRPSFCQVEDEDLLAIGARTHFVLVTDKRVYFRHPSDGRGRAPRWTYTNPNKPDLFNERCKEAFGAYKQDPTKPVYPAYFEDDVKWSMNYLKRLLLNEGALPAAVAVAGRGCAGLLDDVDSDEQKATYAALQQDFWQRSASADGELVDLMSPPRKRLATGCGGDLAQVDVDEQRVIYEALQRNFLQKNQSDDGAKIDLTTPPRQSRAAEGGGSDMDLDAALEAHLDYEDELDRQRAQEAYAQ
ncbi:unnamed protein product, partial [Prorocentrum cordatum]